MDNGSTIDIRLVTNQGKGTTNPNDADGPFDDRYLDTPSPSSSPSHSSDAGAGTGNVIKDEHTYSCNPELKEEMKALETELTAKVIFQNYMAGHSLRRFYPDDPHLGSLNIIVTACMILIWVFAFCHFRKSAAGATESTTRRL